MKLITLTSAHDGAKIYINPEYIEGVCSDRTNEVQTVVEMVGSEDEYYLVKESPDTVAKLAQRKDDVPSAQPDVPDRNVGDTISRQAAIDAVGNMLRRKFGIGGDLAEITLADLPPAQTEPISEAYAKAVRIWLVNYQVKCAELQGRYTPYEVLGWIVSDWRKENEIW